MKQNEKVRRTTVLGFLTALLLVMSFTPLGYLRIGPLSATLNMIPVAIAAISYGVVGGVYTGLIFGLTSFVNALTGGSAMGVILMGIDPIRTMVLSIVPRVFMGALLGLVQGWLKRGKPGIAGGVSGFLAAFLNTVLYMTTLVLLFGQTDYLQEKMAGQNVVVFICTFVGVNAIFEVITASVLTSVLAAVLRKIQR